MSLSTGVIAQDNAKICERKYWTLTLDGQVPAGIGQNEAQEIVTELQAIRDYTAKIKVISCDLTPQAIADQQLSESDGIKKGRYIVFNPTWVRQTATGNRTETIFVFSHEIAHHFYDHFFTNSDLEDFDKELQADSFAGCMVGQLGLSPEAMETLLRQIRPEVDSADYPSIETSTHAALAAYNHCVDSSVDSNVLASVDPTNPSENLKIDDGPPNLAGVRVLYFSKAADADSVFDLLDALRLNYEVANGQNPLQTNELTCTIDVPFLEVKKLAIALIQRGIPLRSIHEAWKGTDAVNRISLEARYETQRDRELLSVSDVMGMDSCLPFKPGY